jgi:predicted CXXCH cytochrome family protein
MRQAMHSQYLLLLIFGLTLLVLACAGSVLAAEFEILTPPPGAKIMARNPETHLVLRRAGDKKPLKVKVEKTGETLNPFVEIEGDGFTYLHYRLPLVPGGNNFSFIPGGERFEIKFTKIQADITLKPLVKDAYLFHAADALPETCTACHSLLETETIQPVGIDKQLACAACHQNLIDKGTFKHGPMINLACLSCHQRSVDPLQIGFPSVGTRQLCLLCHPSKTKWLSRKFTHGPLVLGGCTLCHNPHGENHKYLLWADGALQLCLSCHSDKEKFVRKKDRVPFVHGILFGIGCDACHDPHATNENFMLKRPINELCVSCHATLQGVTLGHPVERHPVSGPVDPLRPGRRLVCTSCHDPHGSSNQYFLIETKLGGRLCRDCHKR